MRTLKFINILNVLVLAIVLLVNYLANALPIGGMNTGEVSLKYANYFVPAGFTFSIWGFIYLLNIIYVIVSFKDVLKGLNTELQRKIGYGFVLAGLLNVIWLFCWHNLWILASIFVMLLFLITLIIVFIKLNSQLGDYTGKNWIYHLTFSVYLGWISIATIANFAALGVHYGLDFGFNGNVIVASILIFIGALLGVIMIIKKQNIPFALVVLWAIFGIFSRQGDVSIWIKYTSIFSMIILASFIVKVMYFRKK